MKTILHSTRALILALAMGAVQAASQPSCDPQLGAAAGFAPQALCRVLDAQAAGKSRLHAVLVMRHGTLVAEPSWRTSGPRAARQSRCASCSP